MPEKGNSLLALTMLSSGISHRELVFIFISRENLIGGPVLPLLGANRERESERDEHQVVRGRPGWVFHLIGCEKKPRANWINLVILMH